jgi:hypothetical protein
MLAKFMAALVLSGYLCLAALTPVLAQESGARTVAAAGPPPVRIAVVPGGGSGMEQEVVDRITADLQTNPHVKVSTVNPDWFVQCNIFDRTDTAAASVRTNGTVVIKTVDNHILNTVSVQTNKQDFSLTPGMPVNKALFDKSVREVIQSLVDRARQPLVDAIDVEMETREKLMKAQALADEDRYGEGIQILMSVSQDSPHFSGARKLMGEFQMEQDAMDLVRDAQVLGKQGQYSKAIALLKGVNPRSKRAGLARALSARYRALAAGRRPPARVVKAAPKAVGKPDSDAQLKALEAQRKALDAQRKAIDAQESALKKSK